MGNSRIALFVASAGLIASACSGTSLVDLGFPNAPDSGSSSGGQTGTSDAAGGSQRDTTVGSREDATMQPPPPEGGGSDDAEPQGDGEAPDATLDGDSPDADSRTEDGAMDDGEAGAAADDASVDAGSFACGPTLRCDPASQYCYVAPSLIAAGPAQNIAIPLDGGSRYSCLPRPACDASDMCLCIQGGGSILPDASTNIVVASRCSCSDNGGTITRTCTGGGPVPLK